MIRILLIFGLLYFLFAFLRWFTQVSPAAVKALLKRILLAGLVVVLLYLTVTGRLGWLVPVIGGLAALLARSLPHLIRFAPVLQRIWMHYRSMGPQSAQGNVSTVETEYLRMKLDHELGEISGEILKGRFSGQTLGDLDLQRLLELRDEVASLDHDAVALIESYLDRIYPNDWRKAQSSREQNARSDVHDRMTREEAYEILGIAQDATSGEIIAAHRRLIHKIHPDRGGSDYLAAKINRAREILLG